MESVFSNEQVLAYVVNETCSDNGKMRNQYRRVTFVSGFDTVFVHEIVLPCLKEVLLYAIVCRNITLEQVGLSAIIHPEEMNTA
jgi:hypothetical protein